MTIRQEILTQIQTFLNNTSKKKKDYRQFTGNLERLIKAPRLEDLNLFELNTCTQIQNFLKLWTNNPGQHPTIFTREKELEQLVGKFDKWFELAQKKISNSDNSRSLNNNNWETRLEQGQKILNWVKWYEKHEQTIKFGLFAFMLLFAWLIIEKLVEKIK